MPFVYLFVSKRFKKESDGGLFFLSSITRVNVACIAKHQTALINQAATKPSVPGEEGDVLKSAWLCFILLPSLEQKQRLTVQSCLALMRHTLLSLSAAHPAGFALSWLPLSGDTEQSSLRLQPGFDLGIKLCCVFLHFQDCAALPSWQENTVFPLHVGVISALSLLQGEKGSFMFSFHFLFLAIPWSLFAPSFLDTLFPALESFCCNFSPRH